MTPEEIATALDLSVEEVETTLKELEAQGLVRQYDLEKGPYEDEEEEATEDDFFDPSVWSAWEEK